MDSLNSAFKAFKDWKRMMLAGTTNLERGNFSDVLLAATTSLMRHPDDSRFSLPVEEPRKSASQGQIRTAAPALKLSELQLSKSVAVEYQILSQTSEERDFDGHGERRTFRYCLQRGFDYYLGNGTILPSKDTDGQIFQWLVVFYINNYPGCQTFHFEVIDKLGALRRLLKKSSGRELTEDDARVMISES